MRLWKPCRMRLSIFSSWRVEIFREKERISEWKARVPEERGRKAARARRTEVFPLPLGPWMRHEEWGFMEKDRGGVTGFVPRDMTSCWARKMWGFRGVVMAKFWRGGLGDIRGAKHRRNRVRGRRGRGWRRTSTL